jgi:drug/metabolite transporter (DMT)-like permease
MFAKPVVRVRGPKLREFLHEKTYLLAVIGAVLIWSTSFVATKIALRTVPPFTLGALRFLVAGIVLAVFLALQRGLVWPRRQDWGHLVLSGVLGITIYFALENLGVKLATAADAALIVAAYPAITMVLESLLYRVAVSRIRFFGVGLALLGVYLVVGESSSLGGPYRFGGDLILVATGVVWSFYNFVTRKVANEYPALLVTFYQTIAGAIAFLPLALLERAQWQAPAGASWLALLYLAIFCSLMGFLLYAYGLKRLTSSAAVTLMNLVPVFGVLCSVFLLGETLSLLQCGGGLIVIAGIILGVRQASER